MRNQDNQDRREQLSNAISLGRAQLVAVARRILRSPEEAEDAVQDGFVLACKSIGDFEGRSSIGTWLHSIVVHAALRRRTRSSRVEQITRNTSSFDSDPSDLMADPAPTPDEAAETWEQRENESQVLRRTVRRLPNAHRQAIVLRDLRGFSTTETAKQLGLTTGAARVRLHRARNSLRSLMLAELGVS